jgi:hypothetical protein
MDSQLRGSNVLFGIKLEEWNTCSDCINNSYHINFRLTKTPILQNTSNYYLTSDLLVPNLHLNIFRIQLI